jgi:hypothetical protein
MITGQIQTEEFIWSRPEEIAAFQAMLDKAPTFECEVPETSLTIGYSSFCYIFG